MRDPGLPFTWALIIGCALWHAAPGDEQPAPAQLGKVVDDKGLPVARARVRLNIVSFEKGVEERGPVIADAAGGFRLPRPFRSSGQFRCFLFAENDDGQMGWRKSEFPRPFPSNGPVQIVLKLARETTVKVTDDAGAPVADAAVVLLGTIAAGLPFARGRTGTDGLVRLRYPTDADADSVFALKGGVGFANQWFPLTVDERGENSRFPQQISLQLKGAFPARVRVVDDAGEPVAGVRVHAEQISYPWVALAGLPNAQLLRNCAEVGIQTGHDGVAEFDWLPVGLPGLVRFDVHSEKFRGIEYADLRLRRGAKPNELAPRDIVLPVARFTTVSGRVTGPDGKPVVGLGIEAEGRGMRPVPGGPRNHLAASQTDADGRYVLSVLPEFIYVISVADDGWAAVGRAVVTAREDQALEAVDFRVIRGLVIRGVVTEGKERRPAANKIVVVMQDADALPAEGLTAEERARYSRVLGRTKASFSTSTNAEGRYQFRVAPGECTLLIQDETASESTRTAELSIGTDPEIVHDFHLERIQMEILSGVVVDAADKPVKDAVVRAADYATEIYVGPTHDTKIRGDAEGKFHLERLPVPLYLFGSSPDGTLASRMRVAASEQSVTLKLAPAATVVGRLTDSGGPIVGAKIPMTMKFRGEPGPRGAPLLRTLQIGAVTTDAHGRFELRGLLVGERYDANIIFPGEDGRFFPGEDGSSRLPTVIVNHGGRMDLGYIEIPPRRYVVTDGGRAAREVNVPARAAGRFNAKSGLETRISEAAADAKREHRRVLLVLGDPEAPATQSLFKITDRIEVEAEWSPLLAEFQAVYVSVKDQEGTAHLKRVYRTDASKLAAPMLVVLGDDGNVIAQQEFPSVGDPPQPDLNMLRDFLKRHALPVQNAAELMRSAARRARDEKKLVLLQQTDSFSYPSRLLTRFIDGHRALLELDYVHVSLDVSRSIGGEAVIEQFRKKKGTVPWMAILNGDGIKLADSDSPSGNVGFPSEPEAIDYFIDGMLKPTARRLTDKQLEELRRALLETR